MNLDDLKAKATELASSALQDETKTDAALNAAAEAAKKVAGAHADKVDAVRDVIDSKLGTN